MNDPVRVAVSGAAGQVAYSLLFPTAAGLIFGPNRPVALSLLETPEARSRLEATCLELEDCDFPLLDSVRASVDPAEAFAGADWAVLSASAAYRPGMSRSEALRENAPIFQAHGRALNESAKTARILVVTNPCNTNCLVAQAAARDIPREHWFALTRLAQNRARTLIARKAGVPTGRVDRVTVWGSQGPTIFADLHNARVDDRPAADVIDDPAWAREVFEPGVADRSRALRDLGRGTPAASGARAAMDTVRELTNPTPRGRWLCAGVASDGSYGVPTNLIFGFPVRTEDGSTWSIVQTHYLDAHAQERLLRNVEELQNDVEVVADFLTERRL